MFIEEGEILTLKNKDYIVIHVINYNNENYVYLISNFKPVDIVIAKVTDINKNLILEEVNDKNVLKSILNIIGQD